MRTDLFAPQALSAPPATDRIFSLLAALAICLLSIPQPALAQFGPANPLSPASESAVRFDVPQLVQARVLDQSQAAINLGGDILIDVELTLSVIVDSLAAPRIDQLLVEITPRGGSAMVADYAPRTELASNYNGGIEVQRTDETTRTVSVAADGRYPPVAGASLTATQADRNTEMMKFNRVAPMHLIAASGTTRRGRGVYFKFRSTDQQIIEGDRVLRMTLRVPATWRGELIEVMVTGDSQRSGFSSDVASFAGLASRPQRVGTGRFLVAAYRGDCPDARQAARRLAVGRCRSGDAKPRACHRVQRNDAVSRIDRQSGVDPAARVTPNRLVGIVQPRTGNQSRSGASYGIGRIAAAAHGSRFPRPAGRCSSGFSRLFGSEERVRTRQSVGGTTGDRNRCRGELNVN